MIKVLARVQKVLLRRRNRAAYPWQWWVSADEEYYQGPYATRDEVLRVARWEGVGYGFNRCDDCQRFYLLEARQGPVDVASYFDGDVVWEQVYERMDEDLGGEDGLSWDGPTKEQAKELDRAIAGVVRAWQRRHGIVVHPYLFTAERNRETYTHVDGFGP